MFAEELNLKVFDTALDLSVPDNTILYSKGSDDRPLYRVWLYVDGPDLPFVDKVTYHLHPTFNPPERTVARSPSNPNCRLEIWTWGVFEVRAIVAAKNRQFELKHQLSYTTQFAGAVSRELPATVALR